MNKIGIFFGSNTGNTESDAKSLQKYLGGPEQVDLFDVSKASAEDVASYDNLIFGCSTWGAGDLQDDFDSFLSDLTNQDLSGKKVAIFGLGDQESYSDTFGNCVGLIYDALVDLGCTIIGSTDTEGYTFDESESVRDGEFLGLILDEENQSDLSEQRIESWANKLKAAFN